MNIDVYFSAGVGRTGVVIAIDSVVAEAKKTGLVDIFNFVTMMRQIRPLMVQTSVSGNDLQVTNNILTMA